VIQILSAQLALIQLLANNAILIIINNQEIALLQIVAQLLDNTVLAVQMDLGLVNVYIFKKTKFDNIKKYLT